MRPNPRRCGPLLALLLALGGCGARDPRPGAAAAPPPASPSATGCIGDSSRYATPRSVAVVPQIPPAELYALWRPLLQRLGKTASQCFDLLIPATIPEFEQGLRDGRFDYAFMNPYHQVMVRRGYVPLVRDGKSPLRGILLVHRDSPARTVQDLRGRVVDFPSPNAFAASLLIRAHLAHLGVDFRPRYVKSHSNVYRAVALDPAVAGGGVNNTLRRERPEIRERLRLLYQTPEYPAHPFSARRNLPDPERERIRQAWSMLARDPASAALLRQVQIPQPVPSSYAADYARLEALQLDRLAVTSSP
jgi:phosphonate transport system substrate-binding protein